MAVAALAFCAVASSGALIAAPTHVHAAARTRVRASPAVRMLGEERPAIEGTQWKVTLSVGREPGTWMPKDWAESGARLSLPLTVKFTEEPVEPEGYATSKVINAAFLALVTVQSGQELQNLLPGMGGPDGDILGVVINAGFILFGITSLYRQSDEGFQGESALDVRAGMRRIDCSGGSFVGAQGEVRVPVSGGAWTAAPTGQERGQRALRWYLDFPEEVRRNDVTIPAGRVFFSTACWDGAGPEGAERQPAEAAQLSSNEVGTREGKGPQRQEDGGAMMSELLDDAGLVATGRSGVQVVKDGGLTIKRNDFRNGFGALGDIFLILGRFNVAPANDDAE